MVLALGMSMPFSIMEVHTRLENTLHEIYHGISSSFSGICPWATPMLVSESCGAGLRQPFYSGNRLVRKKTCPARSSSRCIAP
jgi:hypothetical protein